MTGTVLAILFADVSGSTALYEKLQRAAARVCADPPGLPVKGVSAMAAYSACVKEALGDAVSAVRVPQVAVIHREGTAAEAALAKR